MESDAWTTRCSSRKVEEREESTRVSVESDKSASLRSIIGRKDIDERTSFRVSRISINPKLSSPGNCDLASLLSWLSIAISYLDKSRSLKRVNNKWAVPLIGSRNPVCSISASVAVLSRYWQSTNTGGGRKHHPSGVFSLAASTRCRENFN